MSQVECGPNVELAAVAGLPVIRIGDDLPELIAKAVGELRAHDIVVVTSKIVSRAEGRFRDLSTITPSVRARDLAVETNKDPRLVELILTESTAVSRTAPGVLIVRHHNGVVSANAGVDTSNAQPVSAPPGSGPWVVLLPEDADASAARIREALGPDIGVVISDSLGRPFRLGTVGAAIGVSGLPALNDRRGERDLFGRELEHTFAAIADQVASAADLVAGQAAEKRGVVVVRGLSFEVVNSSARDLGRPPERDLYA